MITLKAHELGWVRGKADDPEDQCAHGLVEFLIDKTTFVKPEDGTWTVSAAALFLLRTLSLDHTPEDSVTENNYLFPCCGFNVWPSKGKFKVVCSGCPNGIDVRVCHNRKEGTVVISSPKGIETVSESEWNCAVLGFVAQIQAFYNGNSPKKKITDKLDRSGWKAFWQEWEQRIADAQ